MKPWCPENAQEHYEKKRNNTLAVISSFHEACPLYFMRFLQPQPKERWVEGLIQPWSVALDRPEMGSTQKSRSRVLSTNITSLSSRHLDIHLLYIYIFIYTNILYMKNSMLLYKPILYDNVWYTISLLQLLHPCIYPLILFSLIWTGLSPVAPSRTSTHDLWWSSFYVQNRYFKATTIDVFGICLCNMIWAEGSNTNTELPKY